MGVVDDEDDFEASVYARGAVSSHIKSDGEESDSCGTWERGHPVVFQVSAREGEFSLPYSGIRGINHTRESGRLVKFVMKVQAALDFDGEAVEGYFAVTVEGDRLDNLMRHIRLGNQTTMHVSAVADHKKPTVTSITIQPWE